MCSPRKLASGLMFLLFALPALGSDFAILRNGFSIRHEHRQAVGSVTRLFLSTNGGGYVDVPTSQIEHFEKDWSLPAPAVAPAPSPQLEDVINSISDRHHIDPDLINSVIHAESGFNPRAVSPKGAQGLMQLMPQTAMHLGVTNAFDPGANVDGGTRYLRQLLERYDFDLIKALAAYNAGPQRVEQYRGVPPYRETRAYVARVIRDFNRKKLAERKTSAATAHSKTPPAKPAAAPVKQASR